MLCLAAIYLLRCRVTQMLAAQKNVSALWIILDNNYILVSEYIVSSVRMVGLDANKCDGCVALHACLAILYWTCSLAHTHTDGHIDSPHARVQWRTYNILYIYRPSVAACLLSHTHAIPTSLLLLLRVMRVMFFDVVVVVKSLLWLNMRCDERVPNDVYTYVYYVTQWTNVNRTTLTNVWRPRVETMIFI